MKQIILAIAALLIIINANAKVWRVNNTPGVNADFTTFYEAQDGATAGDTLMFEGSVNYYNTYEVDTLRKTLTLIGPGYFIQQNYPLKDDYQPAQIDILYIAPSAENAVITGLSLEAIRIDANKVVIDRNAVDGSVSLASSQSIENAVISRNMIYGTLRSGSNYVDRTSTNSLIVNNILTNRSGVGCIDLNSYSTATFLNNYIGCLYSATNCVFKNNLISWNSYGWGEGNSFKNNVFGDELPENGANNILHEDFTVGLFIIDQEFSALNVDNEFQLCENSPALGVGEGGVDCGPFGGSNPYVLSGLPSVPVITEVTMPQSVTTELPISIKAKVQE